MPAEPMHAVATGSRTLALLARAEQSANDLEPG